MKVGRLLLLLALLSPTGCSFFYYAAQNVYSEPYNAMQDLAFRERVRRLAKEAWLQTCATGPKAHCDPYAKGFEAGFVDFVDSDGTGDPPAAATEHMRRELLHSPDGQTAIEDWYAGFRHGAQVAKSSGLRDRYVMPIALPPKPPQDPTPAKVIVPIPAVEPMKTSQRPMKAAAPVEESALVAPVQDTKAAAAGRVGPAMPQPMNKSNGDSTSGYATWEFDRPIRAGNEEAVRRVADVADAPRGEK